jgi:NADH-quinone oxidoreductase subunit K
MTIVPYGHVILLGAVTFLLGLVCIVARRNLIMTLIGIEIMMNAAAIAFIGSSLRWGQLEGQAFVLFIVGVAATEVSVGLALIVSAYRRTGSVDPDNYNILKW